MFFNNKITQLTYHEKKIYIYILKIKKTLLKTHVWVQNLSNKYLAKRYLKTIK